MRSEITYEAQAAIELEMIADQQKREPYSKGVGAGTGPIDTSGLVTEIVTDLLRGTDRSEISARFHSTVAHVFADAARASRDQTGINVVGLSGGVFQNVVLFDLLCDLLFADGFNVLTHSLVPTNDGGLALGQAAIALSTLDT